MIKSRIDVVYFDLGDTIITGRTGRCSWVPGAKSALKTLGSADIRLGILSNTGDLTRQQLVEQVLPTDFAFAVFEDNLIVLSSEVCASKPSAEIFGIAIDRAEISSQNILFCGEKLSEVLSAQSVGMRALQVFIVTDTNETVVQSSIATLAEQVVALNHG